MVEFALVLPLLLLLVVGIMDAGKAFRYWLDETNLANQGARWVAVNRSMPQPLGTHLRNQALNKELRDGSCVTLTYTDMNSNGQATNVGDAVTVQMRILFPWTGFVGRIGLARPTIRASATMRLEAIPSNHPAGSWGACA
jgi:Flp pilus assembly protein TadG